MRQNLKNGSWAMLKTSQVEIFDRSLLAQNRRRLKSDSLFLSDWAAEQIASRLQDIKKTFPLAVELGYKSGTRTLQKLKKTGQIQTLFHIGPASSVAADMEFLPLKDSSLDLITSILDLHTVNDLPGCLLQIKRALKPDGLMLAAMLGGETLFELRESLMQTEIALKGGASPRVFPFADKPQMGALLQRAGFALPVVDSEIVTVTYPDMLKLMQDVRGMGESNIIHERSRKNPGKAFFARAADYYQTHFADADGRIRASFEVIFLIGWAPHESQQQPLRPGSAENSLAAALGTHEMGAGEKVGSC